MNIPFSSEEFHFQKTVSGLRIYILRKVLLPYNRDKIEFASSWKNIKQADLLENGKYLAIQLHDKSAPNTVLPSKKNIHKKIDQLQKQGILADYVLKNRYFISLKSLEDRINFYQEKHYGPTHQEKYKHTITLGALFLGLICLLSASLFTTTLAPTMEIQRTIWGLILVSLLSVLYFLNGSISCDELHLFPDKLQVITRNVIQKSTVVKIAIAHIPWNNLQCLISVDSNHLQGMGICLKNARDQDTLLEPSLVASMGINKRIHRCDLLFPVQDREELTIKLDKISGLLATA